MKKLFAALLVSTIGFAGASQAQTAEGAGVLAGTSMTAGTAAAIVGGLLLVAIAAGGDDGTTTTTTTTTTK